MGYKALLVLEKLLMALPSSLRRGFFAFLSSLAYAISVKRRKIALSNLDFLFAEQLDKQQKQQIVKYSFKNLMFNMMHLIELRHMSKEQFMRQVSVKNFAVVQKAISEKRPIVYIAPHYSAWEFAGASLAVYANPATLVYKHLKNREYEQWLLDSREHFGNNCVEKTNVLKKLLRVVKNKGSIGILIDTNISKKDGIAVKFFDKTIHQTPIPSFLSRKMGALIIPAVIRTDDDKHYEVIFYDPVEIQHTENEEEDIQKLSQMQASWLEEVIRKEPKFWFWLHRRFKEDYPHIYKN